MKKFFQIAAFAVVGFIAFTSANVIRVNQWYVKPVGGPTEVPANKSECFHQIDLTQTGTGNYYAILKFISPSREVVPADITPYGSFNAFFAARQGDLECTEIRLLLEE